MIIALPIYILVAGANSATGQGFIVPVEDTPHAQQCYVLRTDGTRIEGKLKAISQSKGIKNVDIMNANGNKLRIEAADITELGVKVTGLVKMELIAESTETVKKLTNADFKEINNREYIIYQQALMPGQKDRYALLQLLNPGFDSRIKVFQDPWASETQGISHQGISITGGEDKSYLFVKDDGRAFKVKKGSYKKDFDDIFGDCLKMVQAYAGERTRFKDAAEHVWVYDRACED